jgi:hypothetical protein
MTVLESNKLANWKTGKLENWPTGNWKLANWQLQGMPSTPRSLSEHIGKKTTRHHPQKQPKNRMSSPNSV